MQSHKLKWNIYQILSLIKRTNLINCMRFLADIVRNSGARLLNSMKVMNESTRAVISKIIHRP